MRMPCCGEECSQEFLRRVLKRRLMGSWRNLRNSILVSQHVSTCHKPLRLTRSRDQFGKLRLTIVGKPRYQPFDNACFCCGEEYADEFRKACVLAVQIQGGATLRKCPKCGATFNVMTDYSGELLMAPVSIDVAQPE